MSESGHHHGGDTAGQQGFQPGMFPPHGPHHQHISDPFELDPSDPFVMMPSAYGRHRPGARRYRPPAGSPAWFGLWIARLAILAFLGYVAFQIVHGATSTPTP